MNLLPSARDPFSWHAVPGGTPRNSPLGDEVLGRWFERLEADGIQVGRSFRWPGATWRPVVDLSLSEVGEHHYHDEDGDYLPGRSILAVADDESTSVLPRWTPVTFARGWDDLDEDETGTNYWAVSEDAAGVPWLYSALGRRWAERCHLAGALIVPDGHPLVGDDDRVDRLISDLRDITRGFRVSRGLAVDGLA